MEKLKGNDGMTCECGKRLLFKHYEKHKKTSYHAKYMSRDNNEFTYFCGYNDRCIQCKWNKNNTNCATPCERCYMKYIKRYRHEYYLHLKSLN
jgi:hypothetical protein